MGNWGGGRRFKYGAKPTVVDGIRFASKKEAKRYCVLKMMEQAGAIRNLELQPRFPLRVNGLLVTIYVADFRYQEPSTLAAGEWVSITEDVKGFLTREYKIKKKLMKAVNKIQIRET